jgi:hypothetical protein
MPVFGFRPRQPKEERMVALFGGLAERVGLPSAQVHGISFDAVPEFAERCYLWGPDEATVRSFFSPDRLRRLLSSPGLFVAAGGGLLMVYRPDHLVPVEELDSFARQAAAVAEIFV